MTEAQRIACRVRIAYDRFHRTGNAAPLAPLSAPRSRALGSPLTPTATARQSSG